MPNIVEQQVYYRWNLIQIDPDDNKFIDCAIAGGAKYIVTEDKHFKDFKEEDFFHLEIIDSDTFVAILKS